MKAELVWDGKYNEDGVKRPPLRVSLPFQTVETVNESNADRQRALSLFADGERPEWRNRLVWGDKKYVLPSLLQEFAGKVDLIYIDPPFDTGADFSYTTTIPGSDEEFTKEPSIIEQKAYRDTWGHGLDSYLQWFYETVIVLNELLSETGCIYVHLDYHVVHYAKLVLDEVFGVDRFVNEIIWRRKQSAAWLTNQFGITNDTLLLYSKGDDYTFNPEYSRNDENTQKYLKERFIFDDGDGRKYMKSPLINPLNRPNLRYNFHGVLPPPTGWLYSKERMETMFANNELVMPKNNKGRIYRKIYADTYPGQVVQNIWTDIPIVNPMAKERVDYPTQKPEALLRRILQASSNPGDVVFDCFCGSGTTAIVAEKLGRRWVCGDLSRFAIHLSRKRLLDTTDLRPFIVQNLGKYERQAWMAALAGDGAAISVEVSPQKRYTEFILNLYNAKPLSGYAWLHGVKAGRMVHVGPVDAPMTASDVSSIAAEFRKATGSGKGAPSVNAVDILGWDFAFELNEVAKQHAEAANIRIRFVRIPRDVMDKRAVDQGDVRFFELAALNVKTTVSTKAASVELVDFIIPPDDVPEEVRSKIKHWEQWIDYWAVDWDNRTDTFHNQWQSYRSAAKPSLERKAVHQYDEPGDYNVVIKVIDILGNDTTKTVRLKVK